MKTIYKYPFQFGNFECDLPTGAKVLSIQPQHGVYQMWALVDTDAKPEKSQFVTIGTGWGLDPNQLETLSYITTAVVGDFVWHVFQVKK